MLSAVGYVLSFGSQLLISYHFGTSSKLDSYWAAFALVNMLTFYMHPMREALVPEFHRRLAQGSGIAGAYLSQVMTLLFVITLTVSVTALIFPHWLVALVISSRQPEMQIDAARFLRLLAPALLLLVTSETLNAILTCYNKVVLQAVSRVLGALATLTIIATFANSVNVTAVPIGFIAAQLLTTILQVAALYRLGIRFRFGWLRTGGGQFFKLSGALIVSYALAQVYAAMEKQTFSFFGPGIVSSFQYATSLTNVAIALVGSTLANALWPRFLDQVALNQNEKMLEQISMALRFLMIALGWIAVLSFINARPIVQLIFARGAFGPEAVTTTSIALQAAILAAIPIGGLTIISRAFVSLGSIRALTFVSISITTSGLLILLLAKEMGSSHVAMLHWLVANSIGFVVSIWMLYRRCNGTHRELVGFFSWTVRLFAGLGCAAFISPLCVESNDKLHMIFSLAYSCIVFTILFLVFAWLLRLHVGSKAVFRK